FQYLADDLARLVDTAFDAEALFVPDRLLGIHGRAHELGREAGGEPPGQTTDGAFLAVEIKQRDIAFGRGIELDDLRNPETPLEFRPDIGPEPVAAGEAKVVLALIRARRRIDEIAAELT